MSAAKRGAKGYVSSLQGLVKLALAEAGWTREEEQKLARAAVKGNREAQNKLIASAMCMAENYGRAQARQYGFQDDELIAEGIIGLGRALMKFKPEKKIRFATYAIWWVKVYVDRFVTDNLDTWESADGTKKVRFVSTATQTHDDSEETVEDILESPEPGAEALVQDQEFSRDIRDMLDSIPLTGIERSIIQNRFMDDALTLEELGAKHGVSRERVRQIELTLRPRLRALFESLD